MIFQAKAVIAIAAVVVTAILGGVAARYALDKPKEQAASLAAEPKADKPPVAAAPQPAEPPKQTEVPKPAPAPAPAPQTAAAPQATAPAAPAVREAAPRAVPPRFDIVRVEPTGETVVAGRTEGEGEVSLLANGQVIDKIKPGPGGQFVIVPGALKPGTHELSLRNDGGTSAESVVVQVPEPGKGEVLVVVNEPGKPAQILQAPAAPVTAATRPETPAPQVAAAPPPAAPAPAPQPVPQAAQPAQPAVPLRVLAVEVEGGRLFVQGTGPNGARLVIYLNGTAVAQATIGSDSRWTLTVEKGVAPGKYEVRVDQVDEAGKVLARVEVPFTYEPQVAAAPAKPAEPAPAPAAPAQTTAAPAAPAEGAAPATAAAPAEATSPGAAANPVVASLGTVTVRRGDNLWRISRATYGRGARYTVIYQANETQIRNPRLIYPGQIFVLPNPG